VEPADGAPLTEREGVIGGGQAILVLITCATPDEANRIARALVEQRLAACVNVIPHVRSLFSWENKLSEEEEVLLVVKTRRPRFRELALSVKALHSYSVPEIIALPVIEGSSSYLKWIDDVTT
jgi:periplasmic divalent cation tolerance protein